MEQLVSNLGFPIAVCLGIGYYFIQKDKASREDINKIIDNMRADAREDRDMYRETISKFDDKLDKFGIALEVNNSKLGVMESDIKIIKEKVGV